MVLGFKDTNGNSKWRSVSVHPARTYRLLYNTSTVLSCACYYLHTLNVRKICLLSLHRDCTQVKNPLTLHLTGECTVCFVLWMGRHATYDA